MSKKSGAMYNECDIVLGKVRGFPPWPGMVVDPDSVPLAVQQARPGKKSDFYCVQFYPAGNYAWLNSKDISKLEHREIEAYINKPSTKSGGLLAGYRTALDPAAWEAKRNEAIAAAAASAAPDDDEDDEGGEGGEDVHELAEEGEEHGRKRGRGSVGGAVVAGRKRKSGTVEGKTRKGPKEREHKSNVKTKTRTKTKTKTKTTTKAKGTGAEGKGKGRNAPDRYLVSLRSDINLTSFLERSRIVPTASWDIFNAFAALLSNDQLNALFNNPSVESICLDGKVVMKC